MYGLNLRSLFSKFPRLSTERFVLREIMLSDFENYKDMVTNPNVIKYLQMEYNMDDEHAMFTLKDRSSRWYHRTGVAWAVADKEDDIFLGLIGFIKWNAYNRNAEIFLELREKYWGQGVMFEAVPEALKFAFEQMKLIRVTAEVFVGNDRSLRSLKNLNFHEEGIMRDVRVVRGEPIDMHLLRILKNEFMDSQAPS